MSLSASTSAFRRLLKTTFSASLTQLSVCSAARHSSSFPFDREDIGNSNLPPITTPKLFISAKVTTHKVSGRSKGFGFVGYGTIEEAQEARKGMNVHFLDGWVIFVDPANQREQKAIVRQSKTDSS